MPGSGADYSSVFRRSIEDPDGFWLDASSAIDWAVAPQIGLSADGSVPGWFEDGRLNVSFNALDRHVLAGFGERPAIEYISAMTGDRRRISYRELLSDVARFAGVLKNCGIERGDRVIIYMPMIPEAIVAMLACARLGAIHSVVFGGFAARELANRIADAGARAVVTASGGLEPSRTVPYLPAVERALEFAGDSVETVIVKVRPELPGSVPPSTRARRWMDWDAAMSDAAAAPAIALGSRDPLYLLYTSGTTGRPKGILRDSGGYSVAMMWSMRHIYDVGAGEVFWAASDIGWVVGHSYLVYGPLLAGATTVMYEGKPVGTPDAGVYWRIATEYRVRALFTSPTALRAIRGADPSLDLAREVDLSRLKTVFVAGEALDRETLRWAADGLAKPIIDHWWQTETGWPIVANPRGIEMTPVKPGSASLPVPGFDVRVVDEHGVELSRGQRGTVVVRLPMPPGTMTGIWGAPERFEAEYLQPIPDCYRSGDFGYVDEDGYVYLLGRIDDVINVAGHRISTGQLEELIAAHGAVVECAVVGVRDALKGQRAHAFVVLRQGTHEARSRVADELIARVRDGLGAVAAFRDVTLVDALPKTRSGKIVRANLRQLVDGDEVRLPPTIEDPQVIDAIRRVLLGAGI